MVSDKRNSSDAQEMLPVQCKMARAALGWGVRELAAKARVGVETVIRFEKHGEQLGERTFAALSQAIERGGVEFIPENARSGPGVRLKKRKGRTR